MLSFLRTTVLLVSFLFGLMGTFAVANAHVSATTYDPENGAVLDIAPKTIELYFDENIRLTKVSLHLDDQPKTYFELGQFKEFKRIYSLTNMLAGDGLYTLQWRGLADDGHIMQDKFAFTVK